MKVPERIWINSPQDLPCSSVDSNSIEYIRKDAFIEKAYSFFRQSHHLYTLDGVELKHFIEDFKKYMEE